MSAEHNELEVERRGPGIGTILVIIVVFLWLAAQVLLPHPHGIGKKAKIKAAKVQIEANFATALQTFKDKVGRYPTAEEGLLALETTTWAEAKGSEQPIMRKIPRDPWGNEYQYTCPGVHNPDSYDLWSFGPDGKDGGGDDITNWNENP